LAELLARAAAAGFSGMSLTTKDKADGNALAFYLNLGFVPSGRRLRGEIELVKFFAGR
jgi:diamine N-acetyltransferase